MPTLVSRSRGIATATRDAAPSCWYSFAFQDLRAIPITAIFNKRRGCDGPICAALISWKGMSPLSAGWRPATTTSPLFSPRGEAKCVRGPSLQGARCLASGGVFSRLRLDPLTRVDMSVDSASKSACATCVLPGCVGGGTRGASGPHASPTTQTRCVPRESAPEQTSERIRARIRDGQAGIV